PLLASICWANGSVTLSRPSRSSWDWPEAESLHDVMTDMMSVKRDRQASFGQAGTGEHGIYTGDHLGAVVGQRVVAIRRARPGRPGGAAGPGATSRHRASHRATSQFR